jgi:hypothetical protein
MKIDLKSGEVCLSDNRPICLRQARGLRVSSTSGTIWITVTGEPGDIFLQPGQTHELRSNGLAIIESIGDGRVRLSRPAPFSSLRRQAAKIFRRLGLNEKTGHGRPVFLKP